ncbi:MAG: PEP-CTERM sorting domain-containing protein [Phycisphaerae bacterium]
MHIIKRLVGYAAVVTMLASPVRAGNFEDVLDGLRFAGFVVDGTHLPLSNTDVFVVANTLQGNTIDLGDFDFAVAGPVSLLLETGGRLLPEIGLTLSTGQLNINRNFVVTVGQAQPLAYAFNLDTGTNTTNITGNLLFDLRATINTFGSYDFRFQASNRQTTTIDGRFDNVRIGDPEFDIGPVDIEGNIVADVLATVTDPFFDAAGVENIFAEFSGRTFREQQATETIGRLRTKVAAGGRLSQEELATVSAMKLISDFLGDELQDLDFVADGLPTGGGMSASAQAVPEPATALLLAFGALALFRRNGCTELED